MKSSSLIRALMVAAALAPLSAAAAEYTISLVKALTGQLAFVGVPEANAVRLAVDELNASNDLGASSAAARFPAGSSRCSPSAAR